MTSEKDLRETLNIFGIGLEVSTSKYREHLAMYPTRDKHIRKMTLSLSCHLSKISLRELLWYCLNNEDFGAWNGRMWEDWL